jgi:hypothetical protein
MTLVELTLAVLMSTIILAALNSLVKLGLQAQTVGRSANELRYQGRFALERMVSAAGAVAPKMLSAPAAGTTGNWFAPTMFCRSAKNELIETTATDTGCSGIRAIATGVTAFSAQLPAAPGPADSALARFSLTLTSATDSRQSVTLSGTARLGGGTR